MSSVRQWNKFYSSFVLQSADYAKYSHLQGPTFYARTEVKVLSELMILLLFLMRIIMIRIRSFKNRSSQEFPFQIGPPVPLPQAQSQGWWCHIYCLSWHHSVKSVFVLCCCTWFFGSYCGEPLKSDHLPSGWGRGCSRSQYCLKCQTLPHLICLY